VVTQAAAPARARAAAFTRAGILGAVVLILDQVTKRLVDSGIPVGGQNKLVLGIELVHVRNTGVAFSLFAGGGALVLIFTLLALSLLVSYLARRPERPWLWLPTGLLIGGAIGNLIDRIFNGAVTDFIKLPLWPAFNVADTAITFGVLSLLWVLEFRRRDAD
jgi:signal peptidase II